jgi:hypothetical protein
MPGNPPKLSTNLAAKLIASSRPFKKPIKKSSFNKLSNKSSVAVLTLSLAASHDSAYISA